MKSQSIIDLSITSTGTTITLKSHAFLVSCFDGSTVETSVDVVHEEPLSAFCCTSSQTNSGSFPRVFLSSRGLVSSWNLKGLCGEYQFVSKVPIYSTLAATSMCICKHALAVASGGSSVVDIIAVAENLGLSHFRKIDHDSPVQSIALVLNEREHFVLISACSPEIMIRDLMTQACVFKLSPASTTLFKNNIDSLLAARYDIINNKGFIGHYQKHGEFQLLTFKMTEQNNDTNENCFIVEKISEFNNVDKAQGLAMNFVNDNERLCILVTVSDVFIIDSLQKCVVKKISIASLFRNVVESSKSTGPNYFSIASINFPYIGMYSKAPPLLIHHKLDAVFSLAGSLQSPEACDQNATFKPLIMSDQASLHRLNSKLSGTIRTQRTSSERKLVKSSGYCRIEELKLGYCPSNLKREAQVKAAKAKIARKNKTERMATTKYPIDAYIIDSHQEQHDDTENPCLLPPLAAISFDSFGKFLAASTVDKGLHILKLPMSKYGAGSKQVMQSHPSVEGRRAPPLSSCRPSWSISPGTRKMIAYDNRVYSLSATMKSMQVTCDLGENTTNACFCFKDRILIHTDNNKLFLKQSPYSSLDTTHSSKSNEKKDDTFHHMLLFEKAQRITSVASVNAMETHVIAVSCSDKSLSVVDIETGSNLWSQNYAAGARQANYITFPQVSDNIPLSSDNFNLLLATSSDEGGLANLWDLRCGELIKTFQGHTNRRDQCLGSFSPCMRYIGVGGEGNCASATLYDIRGKGKSPAIPQSNFGKNKEGMPFRDDSILDIQFHPLYPQLVTSSLSGRLRWYREEKS